MGGKKRPLFPTSNESLAAPLRPPGEQVEEEGGRYGSVATSETFGSRLLSALRSPLRPSRRVALTASSPGDSPRRDSPSRDSPPREPPSDRETPLLPASPGLDAVLKRAPKDLDLDLEDPTMCEQLCCGLYTCVPFRRRRAWMQWCGFTSLVLALGIVVALQRWAMRGWKWRDSYLRVDPGYRYYPIPTESGLLMNGRPLAAVGGTPGYKSIPYLGVPYASAPVGDRRWRPAEPLPEDAADRTLSAHEYGDGCVQGSGWGSEDCLYLNVYVPSETLERMRLQGNSDPAPRLPVMVYLHGGGLLFGEGKDVAVFGATGAAGDVYNPVIGITINYRLNVFGWLATKELTAEQGTSGNYGLQDIQMALRWVKTNIAQFGGDPDRVTVLGQSSGGTAIMALMSSPMSKGLFRSAIAMSGSPNITLDLGSAEVQNAQIIDTLGCGSTTDDADTYADRLACLRAVPATSLVAAVPESWGTPGIFGIPTQKVVGGRNYPGLPVVDGRVIAHNFQESLAKNTVPGVSLVLGNMGYEPDGHPDDIVADMDYRDWLNFLGDRFETFKAGATGDIMEEYFHDLKTGGPQKAYDAIGADTGLTCGTATSALSGARGNYSGDIYLYVNNWHPGSLNGLYWTAKASGWINPGPYCSWYARHGWDQIVWTQDWKQLYWVRPTDRKHSEVLRTAFYHLAAYGDMRAVGWTPIDETTDWPHSYATYLIEPTPRLVENYKASTCAMYESIGVDRSYWWSN